MSADARRVGDRDGSGRYGILDTQAGRLVCHECGGTYISLGNHAQATHGINSDDYRRRHGLGRTTPLVTADSSAARSRASSARVGSEGWQRLVAARDPAAASASRDPGSYRASRPEVEVSRARRNAASNAGRHQGRTRSCRICGATWCPLPSNGQAWRVTLCGSDTCAAESKRQALAAMVATRATATRPMTADDIARATSGGAIDWTAVAQLVTAGTTQSAIARALGISPATVSTRLSRQRAKAPAPMNGAGAREDVIDGSSAGG